jgi:hypothetical protein
MSDIPLGENVRCIGNPTSDGHDKCGNYKFIMTKFISNTTCHLSSFMDYTIMIIESKCILIDGFEVRKLINL